MPNNDWEKATARDKGRRAVRQGSFDRPLKTKKPKRKRPKAKRRKGKNHAVNKDALKPRLEYRFRFGQYRGIPLSKVPQHYLDWVVRTLTDRPQDHAEASAENARRQALLQERLNKKHGVGQQQHRWHH